MIPKTRGEKAMKRAAMKLGREGDPVAHAMRVTGLSRSEILEKLAAAAEARHPAMAAKYAGTIAEMRAAAAKLKAEGK